MQGSLVDVILVILVIVFAVNGYRQGFFVGLLSFVGFFGGAALGLQLGPWLAGFVQADLARVFISLLTIFGIAIAGQALAGWLGSRLRASIHNRTGQTLDDLGGSLVSVVAVLLVAWLVAAPLGSSALPGLARSVRNSAILHGINSVMPDSAQSLSDALRSTVDTNDFPDVFGELDPTRVRQVPAPDQALDNASVVTRSERSVVKILGAAPSCSRRIEGSGFVYAPEHVLTNAHVVAGTRSVSVDQEGDLQAARVVEYDPERDLAVLYVPGLVAPVMNFASSPADSGDDAIVLGYPLDGPYDAQAARVRDDGPIRGPDIYNAMTVTRDIYTIRGLVRSGNSGGPLIDPSGAVLGVVFAAAADDQQTGFALSAAEAAPIVAAGRNATAEADTGACTDG
ncbi:MarP family serine protease [Rugosimonospora acidiphila]|uniref:MarP family serine protease n=1 Tax=Rugosimonospora acidiphila TaxID=556531 RepID=UPI0031E6251C